MIQILLFIFILAPLSLIWHEIGHMFGASFRKTVRCILNIGVGKKVKKLTYKRITIVIHLFYLINHYIVIQDQENEMDKQTIIITTVMGPIFSLVLSILAYFLSTVFIFNYYLWYITFLFNLWLGLVNLIPFTLKTKKSDGYIILQALKRRDHVN